MPGLRRGNEDVHDGEGDADCEVLLEDGDLFAVGRLDKVDEDFFLTRPEPPRIDLRLIFVHGNSWHKRQPASSLGVLCKSEDKRLINSHALVNQLKRDRFAAGPIAANVAGQYRKYLPRLSIPK